MTFDCQTCGACCYGGEAYVAVTGPDADRMSRETRSRMVVRHGERRYLRMLNGHCAALRARGGHYACRIYEERPTPCRTVDAGSRECLVARERRGVLA
ncbi:MAG: YkgJ family cysteine cluster protein [Polyangia bacterium]